MIREGRGNKEGGEGRDERINFCSRAPKPSLVTL
jgi:hypothetical protein